MASTFSPSLRIELIGDGDQSGIWGQTTNNNLGTLIEQAIAGVVTITMTDANYTLSNFNGVSDEARNQVIVATGTNNAQRDIIIPLAEKTYTIKNSTTGGFGVRIIGSSGTGVVVPNGVTATVYCDGLNVFSATSGVTGNFAVPGNATVTGTTTLSSALTYGGVTLSNSVTGTGSMALSASPTFTGAPSAPTAAVGTNTTQIATTAFVLTNGVPTGTIIMWPMDAAPTGYLNCDGSAVSRSTYATLFALIGTKFGSGDGSTTFNTPNFSQRMPYGVSIGTTGGSADAVVVSHTHTINDPGHNHRLAYAPFSSAGPFSIDGGPTNTNFYDTTTVTTGITINTAGVSGTNANLPPYLGMNFVIKF